MSKSHPCQCLQCKELFVANPRNRWHQKFCTKAECRKASKTQSHRRWLSKPENQDQFRGSANVERVRQWRKAHPGYWKQTKKTSIALQDLVPAQPPEPQRVPPTSSAALLQDLVALQDPLVVGVIAHLIDSPLQDHIEQATLRLLTKGRTILDLRSGRNSNANHHEDQKTNPRSGAAAPHSRTV